MSAWKLKTKLKYYLKKVTNGILITDNAEFPAGAG